MRVGTVITAAIALSAAPIAYALPGPDATRGAVTGARC